MAAERSDSSQINRRDAMKVMFAFLLGGTAGAMIGRETAPVISKENQLERLRNAGLGEFTDLYAVQAQIYGRYGTVLFEEITETLVDVASGLIDKDNEKVKKLRDGWAEKRDADLMKKEAKLIAETLPLNKPVDESHERNALKRLAGILPGLLLNAPERINYDNVDAEGKHVDYNEAQIRKNETPPFSDIRVVGDMHAWIHEFSHAFDWGRLDLKKAEKYKKFITKEDFVNYLTAYSTAEFNILNAYGTLDNIHEALRYKGGDRLVLPSGLPKTAEDWKANGLNLSRLLHLNDSFIEETIKEYNLQFGTDIPLDDPGMVFNIPLAVYLRRLYTSSKGDATDHEYLLSPAFENYRNAAVNEVAHYLVGPAYGSLDMIVDQNNQFNMISLESARVDAARLVLLTAKSKVPLISDLKAALYPELKKVQASEADYGIYPWVEGESLLKNNVQYIGRVYTEMVDPPNEYAANQVRAYLLPPNPYMKGFKQIAIISYTHDIKNDPLGVQFFGKNSRIIFLPEKNIAGTPIRPGDRVVNFSPEVNMVARNPDPTKPYDMISADYYVGSQKAAKIYMDIRELDVSVRQPEKVYLLKVEQADEKGEYKVMDVPCCVIRSFQHGLIELILPPQEEAVGFDPTLDARITHMNETKIISGMGIEPFTITSKCLMTDNVTGLVTHTIEDGQLHLKYTTMGYMENIYAVEAVLSKEDTEKVVRNGFLDVSEYTQLKSQLSLNLAFDTEPTGIKYRAYNVYKPPYNVYLSILNDDQTGVEMNVRPTEVKYINIRPLNN